MTGGPLNAAPPMNGGLAYLATPYRKYPGGPEEAFVATCKLAALLIRTGINVYSPIAHSHAIATHGRLGLHDPLWIAFAETMMQASRVLIVAQMPSWEESVGVEHEVKYFERAGKPIFDCNPATLLLIRRQPNGYAHGKTASEHGGASA